MSRIPIGESIIHPNSYCDGCGKPLDLKFMIPTLSYIFLRGRSNCCQATIPKIIPFCEFGTAMLFALSLVIAQNNWELAMLLTLATITIPVSYIDYKLKKIPNKITYSVFAFGFLILLLKAIVDIDFQVLYQLLVRVLILGIVFFILYLSSRGGIGIGDLKLGLVLSLSLIFQKWQTLLTVFILAFLIAGVAAAIIIILRKGNRKSRIPFGHFMLVSTWITLVLGSNFAINLVQLWSIN